MRALLLVLALLAQEAKPAADLAAAKAAAMERKVRILAVVTEGFYPSEPCRRLEMAVDEKEAAAFVLLRVVEKEDLGFSKGLRLEDLGHPYTAILDAEGAVLATLRGAFEAAAWSREVKRLAAAADAVEAKRAALGKSPADPKALWEWSEALRAAGRVREADEALARAENADPDGKSGLAARFRFRRVEARVEDRMAVQDFEGAKALLDAYEKEFPSSPRKAWVAFYRALCRGLTGEVDGAIEDLKEIAAGAKGTDPDLLALAEARIAAFGKVVEKRR